MNRLAVARGLPQSITVDNGPEFQGQVLDAWAYQANVNLSFIRPGKPNENAHIESFNGKFRDECLNEHWFITILGDALYGSADSWLRITCNGTRSRPRPKPRTAVPNQGGQSDAKTSKAPVDSA